jgi:AP-1-like factor
MAANGQFMSFLDSNQQDLLTAALNSNSNQQQNTNGNNMGQQFGNNPSQFSFEGMDPSLFMNTNNLAMQDLNNFGAINDSPFLDYADNDANFDFENFNDADGQMIGNLPDDENDDEEDDDDNDNHDGLHDKRKSPDDKEDNENGGKRREGEVKEPKKPGRKPLTSEPTNVSLLPLLSTWQSL